MPAAPALARTRSHARCMFSDASTASNNPSLRAGSPASCRVEAPPIGFVARRERAAAVPPAFSLGLRDASLPRKLSGLTPPFGLGVPHQLCLTRRYYALG